MLMPPGGVVGLKLVSSVRRGGWGNHLLGAKAKLTIQIKRTPQAWFLLSLLDGSVLSYGIGSGCAAYLVALAGFSELAKGFWYSPPTFLLRSNRCVFGEADCKKIVAHAVGG